MPGRARENHGIPDILVIDDNAAVRAITKRALESAGFRVRVAADGRQGIVAFRHQPASLVITDIVMPEKEGIEVIRELRSMAPSLPILAISGYCHGGIINYLQMALRLGATAILDKPFRADALIGRIRQMLNIAAD